MEKWNHKLSVKVGEDKVEIDLEANLAGLDMDHFVNRGLKDFAANLAKVVRDGDKTPVEFQAMFQDSVEKYSRGETTRREGGTGPVVSTPEKKAIKDLEYVLRTKSADGTLTAAKVPVPGADSPPLTAKGTVNFNAWAKSVAEAGHPWYDHLLKQARAVGGKLD